jgi:hypothetical protein
VAPKISSNAPKLPVHASDGTALFFGLYGHVSNRMELRYHAAGKVAAAPFVVCLRILEE